jgi:hypothetical protein
MAAPVRIKELTLYPSGLMVVDVSYYVDDQISSHPDRQRSTASAHKGTASGRLRLSLDTHQALFLNPLLALVHRALQTRQTDAPRKASDLRTPAA